MPRKFVKGQSGNPKGRPKMPVDLAEIRKMSPSIVAAIINKYAYCNRAEIKEAIERPGIPMIECVVASIMVKAMQSGDFTRLAFLLDRSIGKVKEEMSISNNVTFKTSFTPDGSLLQEVLNEDPSEYAIAPKPLQIK